MDAKTPVRPRLAARGVDLHTLGTQFLAATAVLLVAALILMSVSLSHLRDSLNQSEAAENTLLEITTIETRLVDFDGTLSSHILTGAGWYRVHIVNARNELQSALKKLRHSLRNEPDQLRKHATVMSLVNRHDALAAQYTAALPRDRLVSAQTAVGQTTDRIRNVLWEIVRAERDRRERNYAAIIADAERSMWIAVGIVFLTFVFGAFCVMLTGPRREAL